MVLCGIRAVFKLEEAAVLFLSGLMLCGGYGLFVLAAGAAGGKDMRKKRLRSCRSCFPAESGSFFIKERNRERTYSASFTIEAALVLPVIFLAVVSLLSHAFQVMIW